MPPSLLLGAVLALMAARPVPAAEPAPASLERLRALSGGLDAGTLTPKEKDELLRALAHQALGAAPPPEKARAAAKGADKVIAAYPDRGSTRLVIEARRPLVSGSNVFVGADEEQATLGDLLSRSKDLYYYSADIPGKSDARAGDEVVTQKTRRLETPSALTLTIRESYTFEQKRLGQVTAVQDGRAMIDRGTLHEVRERDIYKVLDATGAYKGFLEIRGIGDLQSSGVLYNRLEDRRRRALETAPGDRVVFYGQRKLLALGALGGFPVRLQEEFSSHERALGGGLAWDLMFKNGWGVELLFGLFERKISGARHVNPSPGGSNEVLEAVSWKVSYYAPFVVRKNFFFPSVASPFLAVGGTVVDASLRFHEVHASLGQRSDVTYNDSKTTVAPILGAGVDFFPARLVRPRFELRWIPGPTLRTSYKTVHTETVLASFALFTAW